MIDKNPVENTGNPDPPEKPLPIKNEPLVTDDVIFIQHPKQDFSPSVFLQDLNEPSPIMFPLIEYNLTDSQAAGEQKEPDKNTAFQVPPEDGYIKPVVNDYPDSPLPLPVLPSVPVEGVPGEREESLAESIFPAREPASKTPSAPAVSSAAAVASDPLKRDNNTIQIDADWEFPVTPGQSQEIALSGAGWIFLGARGDLEHRLTSRNLSADKTRFSFLFPREGELELNFLKQDLTSGDRTLMNIHVRVINPPEAKAPAASGNPSPAGPGNISPMEPEPPDLPKEVPGFTDWRDFRSAVEKNDLEMFTWNWPVFLSENPKTEPDFLLQAVDFLFQSDREELKDITASFIADTDFPEYRRDEIYIRLGRFYENSGKHRDERLAVEYYGKLVTEYPASRFWDEANRQSRYIKRHYFQIR